MPNCIYSSIACHLTCLSGSWEPHLAEPSPMGESESCSEMQSFVPVWSPCLGRGRGACSPPVGLLAPLPKEIVWICLPKSWWPSPAELSSALQGEGSAAQSWNIWKVSSQRPLSRDRMKLLSSSYKLSWHHTMRNSFDLSSLVAFPRWAYSCRGDSWLHPISTSCMCFLKKLELETLAETKWHGLEVGATFLSLSTWPCSLQVGNTLALSSWPQSSCPVLLCLWPMDGSVGGSQPGYTLQSFFGRLWKKVRQPHGEVE